MPSTKPGARAPALFPKDGKTNIVYILGREFTLVIFVASKGIEPFATVAERYDIPLEIVTLLDDKHAHDNWETTHALIRADGHVAWRGETIPSMADMDETRQGVTGFVAFPGYEIPIASETELKFLAMVKAVEKMAVGETPKFAAAFQH